MDQMEKKVGQESQGSVVRPLKTTPKDFFLHLAVIICLYASTVSILCIIFSLLDVGFPDPASRSYAYAYSINDYSHSIRLAIASLVIMFPLYILFSWLLGRDIRSLPAKADLSIRKWLVYLTLFLSGLTLAVDLVTLIVTFLNGELTLRFVFKVLSVLLVAGAIFTYYILSLKKIDQKNTNFSRNSSIIASTVVIVAIILGFFVTGSPNTVRQSNFDLERISDLDEIQGDIIRSWQMKYVLPADLYTLNDQLANYTVPVDPETRSPYEYQAIASTTFKLCANFDLPGNSNGLVKVDANIPSVATPSPSTDSWMHGSGQSCFTRVIDTTLYPPYLKQSIPVSI